MPLGRQRMPRQKSPTSRQNARAQRGVHREHRSEWVGAEHLTAESSTMRCSTAMSVESGLERQAPASGSSKAVKNPGSSRICCRGEASEEALAVTHLVERHVTLSARGFSSRRCRTSGIVSARRKNPQRFAPTPRCSCSHSDSGDSVGRVLCLANFEPPFRRRARRRSRCPRRSWTCRCRSRRNERTSHPGKRERSTLVPKHWARARSPRPGERRSRASSRPRAPLAEPSTAAATMRSWPSKSSPRRGRPRRRWASARRTRARSMTLTARPPSLVSLYFVDSCRGRSDASSRPPYPETPGGCRRRGGRAAPRTPRSRRRSRSARCSAPARGRRRGRR